MMSFFFIQTYSIVDGKHGAICITESTKLSLYLSLNHQRPETLLLTAFSVASKIQEELHVTVLTNSSHLYILQKLQSNPSSSGISQLTTYRFAQL